VQTLVDDNIAEPILLGRRAVIEQRVREMGLRMNLHETVRVLDPTQDAAVFSSLIADYQLLAGRRGAPPDAAARRVGTRSSVAAAMLLHGGLADAAICGGTGNWWRQIQYVLPIIPRCAEASRVYALSCLILQGGALFVCDTHMMVDPTAEQICEMTMLAAEAVRGFGITPKAALLSHSSFGASDTDSARKMRRALALIRAQAPKLEIDGEMHADAALSEAIRDRAVPDSRLTGTANLLVMPTLDAAHIAFNMLKAAADGLPIGPMLLGMSKPIHVLVPSVTARGIVNLSALSVLAAQALDAPPAEASEGAAKGLAAV
jgi:malate dehydrogenase (oxaloacetate-decarboxylating)(NADP+)